MRQGLLEAFKVAVGIAIPLASFVTGLRTSRHIEGFWLWRRRGLLARSLLAILVLVPAIAAIVLAAVDLPDFVETGLLVSVLAIGLGPVAALKRTERSQPRVAYEVGLNLNLLLLSVVFLPAAAALLGGLLHSVTGPSARSVLEIVLSRAVIPLFLGLLVARVLPRHAAAIAHHAGVILNVGLLAIVGLMLISTGPAMLALGAGAWLTAALIAVASIATGHLLGGSESETRSVLGAFSAMRFPALAVLLAAVTPYGNRLVPVVLMYAITSAVLVAIYAALLAKRRQRPVSKQPRAETGRVRPGWMQEPQPPRPSR